MAPDLRKRRKAAPAAVSGNGLLDRARRTVGAWPLLRELRAAAAHPELATEMGLGPDVISDTTRALRGRIGGADVKTVSTVCPYCAVGCGMVAYVRNGKVIDIEGDPRSPINQGTLCPKGAASFQMTVNPFRWTTVKYRAPYSDHWEDKPLDWAMERIAQLVKKTRDESFVERTPEGKTANHTLAIASLGGATLDNEENYLIKKLFSGGLGMVWLETRPVFDTPPLCPVWAQRMDGAEPQLPNGMSLTAIVSLSKGRIWPSATRLPSASSCRRSSAEQR